MMQPSSHSLHEAAHACIGTIFRIPVKLVRLRPAECHWCGLFDASLQAVYCTLLAGPCADWEFGTHSRDAAFGTAEVDRAGVYARRAGRTLREAQRETSLLVLANKVVIFRVADALMRWRRLDRWDIERLMDRVEQAA